MTMIKRTGFFIRELQKRLEENHMKHAQVLFGYKNGLPIIKIVSLDLPGLKDRVKDLINGTYPESFVLVEEKKTVLIYHI